MAGKPAVLWPVAVTACPWQERPAPGEPQPAAQAHQAGCTPGVAKQMPMAHHAGLPSLPRPQQVQQGGLDSCWLLAAAAAVAHTAPHTLQRRLHPSLTLWNGTQWHDLPSAPDWAKDALPRGVLSSKAAAWPAQVEAGAASLCVGEWAGLAGGGGRDGLRMLTAAPVLSLDCATGETRGQQLWRRQRCASVRPGARAPGLPSTPLQATLWRTLRRWDSAGHAMVASCSGLQHAPSAVAGEGGPPLKPDHAYAVLGTRVDGPHGTPQVWLFDPACKEQGEGSPGGESATPLFSSAGFTLPLETFAAAFRVVDAAVLCATPVWRAALALPHCPKAVAEKSPSPPLRFPALRLTPPPSGATVTVEACRAPGRLNQTPVAPLGGDVSVFTAPAATTRAIGQRMARAAAWPDLGWALLDAGGTVLAQTPRAFDEWSLCTAALEAGQGPVLAVPVSCALLSSEESGAAPCHEWAVSAEAWRALEMAVTVFGPAGLQVRPCTLSEAEFGAVLAARCVALGRRQVLLQGKPALQYTLEGDAGMVLAVENGSEAQALVVRVSWGGRCANVLASREGHSVTDVVPPLSRQLVLVLTQANPAEPFRYSFQVEAGLRAQWVAQAQGAQACRGMHGPVPL